MTLTTYPDLEQGTEEWLTVRRGIVTASVVGQLISVGSLGAIDYECPTCQAAATSPCLSVAKAAGKSGQPIKTIHSARSQVAADNADQSPPVLTVADSDASQRLTDTLAAERISGNTDATWVNADMWRGVNDEPLARDLYARTYAPVTQVGFMTEDKWGFTIGFSPDGLVGDDGFIEVKSRRQHTHVRNVIDGEVPAYNMAQIQCGFAVSGRSWCDYLSYCGGLHLWPKRVYPDPVWQEVILAAVSEFETNAADVVAAYNKATIGLPMTERVADLELVF